MLIYIYIRMSFTLPWLPNAIVCVIYDQKNKTEERTVALPALCCVTRQPHTVCLYSLQDILFRPVTKRKTPPYSLGDDINGGGHFVHL